MTIGRVMIYLFLGDDEIDKQNKIRALKQKLFDKAVEQFNYETLDAKSLEISCLKESVNRLPVSCKKRLLVIKNISQLKESIRDEFLSLVKNVQSDLDIVLDAVKISRDDTFLNRVAMVAKSVGCQPRNNLDAFALADAIGRKQTEAALNILSDLFKRGEKPEKILGGLRYRLTRNAFNQNDRITKVGLLLDADLKIKTGRLKPEFALEALIIRLIQQ